MNGWTKTKKWVASGLLAVMISSSCLYYPVSAAGLVPANIRVAMFLDLGSTYRSTTNVVTITSAGSYKLGLVDASGAQQQLQSVNTDGHIRYSLDTYRVKVLETTDWSLAEGAYNKLSGTSDQPVLFSTNAGGKTVYQVYTGTYANEQAAKEGAVRTASTAGSFLNGQVPIVKGSKHLSAGVQASEQAAESLRSTILATGVDAMVVQQLASGGGLQYAVWVGEAINDAELLDIQTQLGITMPQLALIPVDEAVPAVIIRKDAGYLLNSSQAIPHYQLSGNSAKLWLEGNQAGLTVLERSKRTYRGSMEISSYNGQLALVNEVPVEEYLYSVVGSEIIASWPSEALKAQAVASRSYALFQSNKYKVADVVDTTLSQVYNGIAAESPNVVQAVNATANEVLVKDGKMIEAVFYSNGGGYTADPTEVWNSSNNVFAAVQSEGDQSAESNLKQWFHVLLPSGKTGYIREDNAKLTGTTTAAGLPKLTVTANDTNVRVLPLIQSAVEPITKMNPGDTAIVLELVSESNSYSWIRGPFTSAELVKSLTGKASSVPASISTLEVTKRGPSGRVIEMKANGQIISVKYPDLFRSAMNGLPSTLFSVVPSGSYSVMNASGQTDKAGASSNVSVISASGTSSIMGAGTVVLNADNEARVVEQQEGFLFIGQGNGHGLGLSQWGTKGMADAGYDYQEILKHYYQNVTIVKD